MSENRAPGWADFAGQDAVSGLREAIGRGAVPHAMLITGQSGVGKRSLAGLIARTLLCTAAEGKPCGRCAACVQALDGNHPDLVTLRPGRPINPRTKAGAKHIPVDDVREAIRLAGEHSFEGGRRVICVEQADSMLPQAQNALLKTLEEPPGETVLLLITDAVSLLLTTIRSRCREVCLHAWPDGKVRSVLRARGVAEQRAAEATAAAGGSIGRAVDIALDEAYWQRRAQVMRDCFDLPSRSAIIRVSGAWKDRREEADELLDDVEDMLRTLLLVRTGRTDPAAAAAFPEAWRRFAAQGELADHVRLLDRVADARQKRMNQVTWQAVLEQLLLGLMEVKSRWQT